MRLKTFLMSALLITVAGLFLGRSYVGSYVERRTLEAGRERAKTAAKNAAMNIGLRRALAGEWIGENRTVTFSADNSYRESHSTQISGSESGVAFSYRLSYVLTGRWQVASDRLTQEVTGVTDIAVTSLKASSDRVSEPERVSVLRRFRETLLDSTSQALKKEMVGRMFVSDVAFPSPDTLILKSSTDARRYSRVR
jgi:hypothetical protein